MSILIPLLLPSVVNATANVGKSLKIDKPAARQTSADPYSLTALGITNAVQGTSTNISFKIGNKVFTTSRPFPFDKLPPELRMEIIEMALEMSKESVISEIRLLPISQHLTCFVCVFRQAHPTAYGLCSCLPTPRT